MSNHKSMSYAVTFVFWCCLTSLAFKDAAAWGSNNQDRVLLEKVTAITLEDGKMTNARRSSPIPQLDCAGGSAGCHSFRPRVVQCRNVGFDGYDVQWECTADMDPAYRFGRIEVSCEGYDRPDDPYILRGSCGLRYEIDLTAEGKQRGQGGHYHDNQPRDSYQYNNYNNNRSSGGFGWGKIIGFVILGCVIYYALKCCCGVGRRTASASHSAFSSSQPTSGGSHFTSGTTPGMGGGGSGGGFWSGAATGGLLGYLLGGRGGGSYWGRGGYSRPYYGGGGYRSGGGWGSGGGGWGSGGGGGWSSGSRSSSRSSSSSRSTSGFGGTSRR